jgi:UDP-GlcNAc:undecaprenyl-phosphate/decaprenyl-phosphate GlcNAc-1-phosphate transferase
VLTGCEIALVPLVAFGLALAIIPFAKVAAVAADIVVLPSGERPHSKPTPMLGGIAIIASFVATVGIFAELFDIHPPQQRLLWLVIGSVAMFLVGLLDDVIELRPRYKLGLELVAIFVLAGWGPQLDIFSNQWINIALTTLWLLTATNAFNLIDGMDGLAAGVGIVTAIAVAAIAGFHNHNVTMMAALAMAGSLMGFLVFNFPPASIFMGDEGALAIGLIFGVLSIQASHAGNGSLPARLAIPILVLMMPLLDTVTVTVTRLAMGNPISKRGLDHSHHRLSRLGLSTMAVLATVVILQTIAGGGAVAVSQVPGYEALLILPFLGLFFAVLTLFMMDRSFDPTGPGQISGLPPIARLILGLGYKRRVVEGVMDVALIAGAYFGALLIRFDFNLRPGDVEAMLAGLPWIVLLACGAFLLSGVYRGIWRYSGLSEVARFALASAMAGGAVELASTVLPIAIARSTSLLFVLLLFNFLVATRWSFHIFLRIGRLLAQATRRSVIIGADECGAAAIRHLQATIGTELLGIIDDDNFKRGKLFHGYPVVGALSDLDAIFVRMPFDEIVVAQENLPAAELRGLQDFARFHGLSLRRFLVGVMNIKPRGNQSRERIAVIGSAVIAGDVSSSGS